MATSVRSVIGEVSTGTWTKTDDAGTTHWDAINEDPDTPNDADYIETTTNTDTAWFTLATASLPANFSECNSVSVDVRGYLSDAGSTADLDVELWTDAGTTQLGATTTIDVGVGAGQFDAYGTTLSNATITFSGTNFPITKTQAEDLRVKLVFQTN